MTKSEMPKNDSILLGPGLLLNQYADYAVSEHAVLWICAVSIADMGIFCRFAEFFSIYRNRPGKRL